MSTKENLDKAKIKQDDEFYTGFADIALELDRWTTKLKNKRIICPCDFFPSTEVSSITIDFSDKVNGPHYYVNAVKLRKSIMDFDLFADLKKSAGPVEVSALTISSLLQTGGPVNFVYYLLSVAESTGIKSVTASGYDVEHNLGISFNDIDYSQYDICITNPPFSKYSRFMQCMIEAQASFDFNYILIAPFINRIAPCIGVPLMERRAYLGYGRHLAMEFLNPTTNAKKKVAVDWITSYTDAQEQLYNTTENNSNSKIFNINNLKEMPGMTLKDGTHPLHLKSITELPDTDRWLFTSAAVLDRLKYIDNAGYEWYATGCKKYFNKEHTEKNPFIHKVTNEMIGYGTEDSCFHGILFRKIN